MKKMLLIFLVVLLLQGLSACGGGKSSVDYESIAHNFTDAILAGKFEDAKAMLTEENMEVVSAQVDQFASIYDKYKFQEILLTATVAGNSTGLDSDTDKRTQFTFQFSPKESDDWAHGWLDLRVVNRDGMWVITEFNIGRPKK